MKISKPFDNVVGFTKCGQIVSYSPVAKLIAVGCIAVGVYPNEIADIAWRSEKLLVAINAFNNHSFKKYKA